jgi:UDP-2-acetamido-3-amino-2,3-dideoxy-glucuronate N-acetyltransferase
MNYISHNTAIVDKGAVIGSETKIWHWTHICSGAKIGKYCSLGQNVFVGNKVLIGNNVKIQNNVSVYDNVVIEDDVFCGPSMVFTNVYNPRSAISRKDEYKNTVVKKGASLGANCTIICGTIIGKYAFVGAGSVVTKNIKDYALMVGVPAKQIGWISEYGKKLQLPIKSHDKPITAKCPATSELYRLKDECLIKLVI